MKTLKHGQQVRFENMRFETPIKVQTLEGLVPDIYPTVEAAFEHHRNFTKRKPEIYNPIAWTIKCPVMLSAYYEGKADELAEQHEAFKNAVVLKQDETVEIEGRKYKVDIVKRSERLSDPIHFIAV